MHKFEHNIENERDLEIERIACDDFSVDGFIAEQKEGVARDLVRYEEYYKQFESHEMRERWSKVRRILVGEKENLPEKKEIISRMGESCYLDRFFYSHEGEKVEVFHAHPKKDSNNRLAVYLTGGAAGNCEMDDYNLFTHKTTRDLLERGYGIISPQYPGSGKSEGVDQTGGSDVAVISTLFTAIKNDRSFQSYENAGKPVFIGESRGGMMLYQVMRDYPEVVGQGIVVGGPVDMRDVFDKRSGFRETCEKSFALTDENIRRRSANEWFESVSRDIPLYVLHGERDKNVPIQQLYKFKQKISATHPKATFVFDGDMGHMPLDRDDLRDRYVDWIDRNY